MTTPDILEYIRAALQDKPTALLDVEPVLRDIRQTYGGETVYIPRRDRVAQTRTICDQLAIGVPVKVIARRVGVHPKTVLKHRAVKP